MNEDRQSDADASLPEYRRNFRLVAWNGVLTGGGLAFFDPTLVIAAFIIRMDGSETLIGVVGTLVALGWLWPQLFVANLISPWPRKMGLYRWAAAGRVVTLSALALLMWVFSDALPGWFVWALVGLFFVHWSFSGVSGAAWYEVLSKVIAPSDRASVFAWRQSGSQAVGMVAGLIVGWVLGGDTGLAFPTDYLLLLLLTIVSVSAGLVCFTVIREPVQEGAVGERRPWGDYFRLAPELLRANADYRRLVSAVPLFALAVMGTPFFVPFLIRRVGMTDGVVGPLIMVTAFVNIGMTLLFGRLGKRRGNRTVLVFASRFALLSPMCAACAAFLPGVNVAGVDVRFLFIALATAATRAAGSAMVIGRSAYLIDISPQGLRPVYYGFFQAFSVVTTFVPVMAGVLVGAVGYATVFVLGSVFGILCAIYVYRLGEPAPAEAAPHAVRVAVASDSTRMHEVKASRSTS